MEASRGEQWLRGGGYILGALIGSVGGKSCQTAPRLKAHAEDNKTNRHFYGGLPSMDGTDPSGLRSRSLSSTPVALGLVL